MARVYDMKIKSLREAYRRYERNKFRLCELMLHLDSALVGAATFDGFRSRGLVSTDGAKWWITRKGEKLLSQEHVDYFDRTGG